MTVRTISDLEAAVAVRGLAGSDPRGLLTEKDLLTICVNSERIEVLDGDGSSAVVVFVRRNGVHWVHAIHGGGHRILEQTEAALRGLGARSIAFQTKRAGLVRRAMRHGYKIAGYIMSREL